jgi:CRP/FNR family nitrogen fixation transcriptional regulator
MFATFQPIDRQSRPAISLATGAATASRTDDDVLEPLVPQAVTVQAERDDEIVAQGEPAGYCYQVVSGCVRTVQLMEDGRRQVGEFLFPGDLFGWDAVGEHDFAAEAVTPVTLRRYPTRSLDALADANRDVARRLRVLSASRLRAGRDRVVLLGRKTASERIASFLIEMARRINPDGRPQIDLPMCRTDMADYLGLTIETVCRGLTQLRRSGTIAVTRANIAIRDRHALGAASCAYVN